MFMPPKPDTPEERPRSQQNKYGRRSFIAKALAAGAVGGGAYFLGIPRARAEKSKEATETPEEVAERHRRATVFKKRNPDDKPDPSYRNHTRRLGEQYEYKEAILSPDEIKLMDESMRAIFRSFIQPSFFMYAVPALKGVDVKKAMELAILNHGALEYTKNEDGYIVIKKRRTNKPSAAVPDNFIMKIKDGVITEINGEKIDMRALRNWKEEWGEIRKRLPEITGEAASKHPLKTDRDLAIFEFCYLKLPRDLRDLIKLKITAFGQNDYESEKLKELENALKTHPSNTLEYFIGNLSFLTTYTEASGEIIELVDTNGDTFLAFSPEGFIQTNSATSGADPAWQNSSESFEDLYKRNNGI